MSPAQLKPGIGLAAFPAVGTRVGGLPMPTPTTKDPLHGVTLEMILTQLVANYGWAEMGRKIDIRCIKFNPSIKSSLQLLRRTPWARQKVEALYLHLHATANGVRWHAHARGTIAPSRLRPPCPDK